MGSMDLHGDWSAWKVCKYRNLINLNFSTTYIISIPNSILSGYMLYAKQDSNKIEVKGIGSKITS